jgi:ATP-binding cassette subfamily B protein
MEQVRRAAKLAHADGFIQALPDGYETHIGERGERLSQGQVRRLALARALLKDAPVLILDEATAHLDPGTAAKVEASVRTLASRRTTLLIAHHLGMARLADRILLLVAGELREKGTHEGLITAGGLYSRMVRSCHADPGANGHHASRTVR